MLSARNATILFCGLTSGWLPACTALSLNFSVDPPDGQQVLTLSVQVVNQTGEPIEGAKVTPWALRSSQGHGLWQEAKKGVNPQTSVTNQQGVAEVAYPLYRSPSERVRTLAVSLHVDHPDYGFVGDLHIDVPLGDERPHRVELQEGAFVELVPTIDGNATDLDGVYALWSDGRSWQADSTPTATHDGAMRLPAATPGALRVRLVRIEDEIATHFSPIVELDLVAGETARDTVELLPSVRVAGRLDDAAPRPIKNGRLSAWTLSAVRNSNLGWMTCRTIDQDGRFVIEGWPQDEAIQIIALADGVIGASGVAPEVVVNPRDPDKDPFQRPQVFQPDQLGAEITITTEPLVRCEVQTVDLDGNPVAGAGVWACPNVGWWNSGSQIYCGSMMRGERLLVKRDYSNAVDESFSPPFRASTDDSGRAVLMLPDGRESIGAWHEELEMPIFIGSRTYRVNLEQGETTKVRLMLQPKGTEQLGDWDKLAGVVFGCSTREGQRICAMPGVRQRMEDFRQRLGEAENPRDPALLAEAYAAVALTLSEAGYEDDAIVWRKKAEDQEELAKQEE